MQHSTKIVLAALSLGLALPSLAAAQATRTWVSGVGDDANPCSRTAPCKTFAGAISKTAAGGEISALDPGGYGAVTITKAITINGDGTLASVLAAGVNGIIINAGASDVVILRNLSLQGVGTGLNGIRFLAGRALIVENVTIQKFTLAGIDVNLGTAGSVAVKNTTISGGLTGVRVNGAGSPIKLSMTKVLISGTTNGIDTWAGATTVTDSSISNNAGYALLAEGGVITAENTMLTGNGGAAIANAGATIRLSNNGVYDNLTDFGCGGGTLASAGNNRKAGNAGGGVPVCAPNAAITLQ
jgi:hypothetical protein